MRYIPITSTGKVPVDAEGNPVMVDSPTSTMTVRVSKEPLVWACAIDELSAQQLGTLSTAREFAARGNFTATRAIALMGHRQSTQFNPATGNQLDYPGNGIMGVDSQDPSRQVFPRVDPAIIVMVKLAGTDKILLGRNVARPHFYSLIAGYVDLGESLEQACVREVWEETGRRIKEDSLTYYGSHPWVASGSLMMGFVAETEDVHAVVNTDEELDDIVWVDRETISQYSLPRPGSIARNMIMEWLNR